MACLIFIYRNLTWRNYTLGERWCVYLPLSALAAWLTVAATVNIAASLRYHGLEGGSFSPLIGATVVVTTGMIAAAALIRGQGNPQYAAVFLWALTAIHSARGQQQGLIVVSTIIAGILVIGGSLIRLRAIHVSKNPIF